MSPMLTLSRPPKMLPMYARAAAGALPGGARLAALRSRHGEANLTLRLLGVRADPVNLAAYRELCGFPAGEILPLTYPHVLAFPLHMMLLTSPASPYPPVGLIHIENRILTRRPIHQDEAFTLHARLGHSEPHPRGRAFALVTELILDGDSVWKSASTMLHRHSTSAAKRRGSRAGEREHAPETARATPWILPRDLGRRYAALSGDRNPIHTHPLAARALGFPGMIAHGMWTKARALAELAEDVPGACAVHVSFHRPIVLPAAVQLTVPPGWQRTGFSVRDRDRHTLHLRGRLWPIDTDSEQGEDLP